MTNNRRFGHFPNNGYSSYIRKGFLCFSVVILSSLVSSCSQPKDEIASCTKGPDELSIFMAGDAIITQPWSHIDDPSFLRLVNEIRKADVALVNLEMLIHEFKGYAQADSGGTYMAATPNISEELVWAGFDMVAHANNHTFDYGSTGVLETLENVEKAGLVLAGSGKDLQHASAPGYFYSPKGTVAVISSASTFVKYGRASRSRPDFHGRPGLNAIGVSWEREVYNGRFFRLILKGPGSSGSSKKKQRETFGI